MDPPFPPDDVDARLTNSRSAKGYVVRTQKGSHENLNELATYVRVKARVKANNSNSNSKRFNEAFRLLLIRRLKVILYDGPNWPRQCPIGGSPRRIGVSHYELLGCSDIGSEESCLPPLAKEMHYLSKYTRYNASDADTFATSYGWPIDSWDVSRIQDFSSVFTGQMNFNETINSWNTANVTNMSGMFCCGISFNQDLPSWNTANVTNMSAMFGCAASFNQDLSSWNTSN
eukprot:scaffold12903_cov32-Attheya_sp.AAC.1